MLLWLLLLMGNLSFADCGHCSTCEVQNPSGNYIGPQYFRMSKDKGETVSVTIFHTSDIHGYAFPHKAVEPNGTLAVGGLFSLGTLLERKRRELWRKDFSKLRQYATTGDDGILLIDLGDNIAGTLDCSLSKGRNVITMQNSPLLDYDVGILGNHAIDYDKGPPPYKYMNANTLARRFPVVHSTLLDRYGKTMPQGIVKTHIEEVNGIKFGFFGLTCLDTTPKQFREERKNYVGEDCLRASKKAIARLREQGVNVVMCLAHLGLEERAAKNLLADLAALPIDVIIDGHSHNPALHTKVDDDTFLAQVGFYGRNAGEIELHFTMKTKKLQSIEARRHSLLMKDNKPSQKLIKAHRELYDHVRKVNEEPIIIGFKGLQFSKTPRTKPQLLNPAIDFVARGRYELSAFKDGALPDIVLASQKSVRYHIISDDDGVITANTLHQMLPFGNLVCLLEANGAEIRQVVSTWLEKGNKLSWAGAKLKLRTLPAVDAKDKRRYEILSFQIWNRKTKNFEPLVDEKTYKVSSDDYFVRKTLNRAKNQYRAGEIDKYHLARFLKVYQKRKLELFTAIDPLYPTFTIAK